MNLSYLSNAIKKITDKVSSYRYFKVTCICTQTICVICTSIEVKHVFLVYCAAPCRVNATDNLISKEVYLNGTKADLKCKDGFLLIGMINGDRPVCFNGTWKFDGKEFSPSCETEEERKKVDNNFWDKLYKMTSIS